MKKFNKKRIATFLVATGTLLTTCMVPALAYDATYLDLRVSGRGYDYSYFQNADTDNGDWCVDLDHDYDRDEVVLCARLENSEYDKRGYMKVFEGTSNVASSTCADGHDYRIKGMRERWYDGYVTIQGHWDLNY